MPDCHAPLHAECGDRLTVEQHLTVLRRVKAGQQCPHYFSRCLGTNEGNPSAGRDRERNIGQGVNVPARIAQRHPIKADVTTQPRRVVARTQGFRSLIQHRENAGSGREAALQNRVD